MIVEERKNLSKKDVGKSVNRPVKTMNEPRLGLRRYLRTKTHV